MTQLPNIPQSPSDRPQPILTTEKSPLRILHIVTHLQVGGLEYFVLQIAAAQRRQGHDVTLLATHGGGPLVEAARDLGLRVIVLNGAAKIGRILHCVWAKLRIRPDIVHAHNPATIHYGVLGKQLAGGRVVLTFHGQAQPPNRLPRAQEWAKTDAVVAVSHDAARRMLLPEISHKLTVIHNGIMPHTAMRSRATVRAKLGLDDGPVGIIVARMDGFKGHTDLLRAAALLQERGQLMTLLVVGDGTERAECERLASELGLGPERVRFLGFRSDVSGLLAASDFFALPSQSEGLSLSILEAMSHGLPVVATRVGGNPELITSGENGLLTPVGDIPALADALSQLAGDPARRATMGAAGARRARGEFLYTRMLSNYETLYYDLLTRRSVLTFYESQPGAACQKRTPTPIQHLVPRSASITVLSNLGSLPEEKPSATLTPTV